MRKPTPADAELLMRLYEIRREPELRRARQWFLKEFKPVEWSQIKPGYLSFSDEDRWFRMTISYWEMVGAMVNREILHPELFFDHTGEDIPTWDRCKAFIAGVRADIRPSYLIQIERMVTAHLEYRKKVNAAVIAEAQRPATASTDGKRARLPAAAKGAGAPRAARSAEPAGASGRRR
jgi:hypothetical protein